MRLFPQTLFGRTAMILMIGLAAIQVLNIVVDSLDRGHAFYRATTLEVAQRIADMTRALDALKPEARAAVVAHLSSSSLGISLTHARGGLSAPAEQRYADTFRELLQRDLGPGWTVQVRIRRTPVGKSERLPFATTTPTLLGRYLMPRLLYPAPRGFSYMTSVRLKDGSWVSFSARLPYVHVARPSVLLPKFFLTLAAALLLLLIAIRWVTQPLKALALAALRLGDNLHRPPMPETGPVEIRDTARAFNLMQERLARHIRNREYMLAAMSHDLKTFITRLRLRTELLPASDHQSRMVEDLRDMGLIVHTTLEYLQGVDRGQRRQQLDITALIESLRGDAEDLGYTVEVIGRATRTFSGNAEDLRRCLGNLIENAAKYAGPVTVRIHDSPTALTLIISDRGPGIPEHELTRVFEPFYRLDRSRDRATGGTGLGLSIARDIVRAHHGDISLRNLPGGGLEAVLTFPYERPGGSPSDP